LAIVLFGRRYVKTTRARVVLALSVMLASVAHAWLFLSIYQ